MNTIGVVPAYNEEDTIGEVVDRLRRINIQPLVVDDGSTDNTTMILNDLGVETLVHDKNEGKGEALLTAFNHIFQKKRDTQYVVVVDGDLQYNPLEATRLLKPLIKDKADYIIGKRDWSKVPFRHRFGNFTWVNAFNDLFETRLEDVCCGFVAMKREVMEILDVGSGYVVDVNMLIQALTNGYRVKNVPVSVSYKNKSGIRRGMRMVMGILMFMKIRHDEIIRENEE